MNIALLMPWRDMGDPWRRALKDWIGEWWMAHFPTIKQMHATGPLGGLFNRSAALNDAARRAAWADLFIIVDMDTVPVMSTVALALSQLDPSHWLLPYTVYYNLDQPTTEAIVRASPYQRDLPEPTTWEHRLEDSVSGCVIVPRALYCDVGGFDERFCGWGFEDRAFHLALQVLHPGGRMASYVQHLWHHAPLSNREGAPQYALNEEIYEIYRQEQYDPGRMRAIVNGRKYLQEPV